ncbi:alanine racemase [Neisseria sp.]|uniref:alanine racemase n=1 Tax=Neisseria sp. TaxID=192066 RepID=UPI0028969FCF|nr:alanine racemase [Neisseria sp.]
MSNRKPWRIIMHFIPKLTAVCLSAALLATPVWAAPPLNVENQQPAKVTRDNTNAWLEIDAAAYGRNIEALKKHLRGKAQICAILKADAYGNSIDLLMPTVIQHNVPCIGIGSNEEAREARAHGYQGRVMRVRAASLGEIRDGMQYDMEELFGNLAQAQAADKLAQEAGKKLRFHLGLNSAGMDRNGLDLNVPGGKDDAVAITKLPNLQIVGIMTHFPVEDKEDVKKGLKVFKKDSKWLIRAAKLDRKKLVLHTANSFVTLNVPEGWLDLVRPGGILYGEPVYERPEYEYIMSFKTRVASVNSYPKGSTVGYDRTFTLARDSRLANLPFGYSDGYRRVFTNKGHVLIRGHKVPVVGKVSMNTTMVDVTDFPDIQADDEVVIFGKQGGAEITQSEVEDINGALFADLYTVWGNSNPKLAKPKNTP